MTLLCADDHRLRMSLARRHRRGTAALRPSGTTVAIQR